MIIKYPARKDVPALRRLWKQAFQDTDALLDDFFSIAFAPERSLCAWEDGGIVAMLYWFDCTWQEKKVAYVYAVATDREYRKRGISSKLLKSLHIRLKRRGYDGAILVPSEESLVAFYQKQGYDICCTMERCEVDAQGAAAPTLRQITRQEYSRWQQKLQPEDSVDLGEVGYRYLETYAAYYCTEEAAFCGVAVSEEAGKVLQIEEYLGDPSALPAIGVALGCRRVAARIPGKTPYAMFYCLTTQKNMPKYFGMPMG